MNTSNSVFIGTELKLTLNISPIEGLTMSDYEWEVEVFTSSKRGIILKREDCVYLDDENYILLINSELLGIGEIKCKVTAYIPDEDFQNYGDKDGIRKEVLGINTGVFITKDYE